MVEERRKFVRLNALTDVVYSKMNIADKEKLSLGKNISQGGICIISYEKLQEEDVLDLKIYLPENNAPVTAIGRVVWTREFVIGDIPKGTRFDVGIEFIKINNEDLDKIKKYVFTRG